MRNSETIKLLSELETSTDTVEMTDGLSAIGKVLMDTVKASAKTLESKMHSLQQCFRHGQDCTAIFEDVDAACSDVLAVIADANLPKVKPGKVTCADAGPGVGINNNDVRFRDAECARKDNMDYSIRVHRKVGMTADRMKLTEQTLPPVMQWGSPSASDPRAKNTGQRATKGTVLTSQSLSPWCDCRRLGSTLTSWRWQDINVGNPL